MTTPAGWFPDPEGGGGLRYWDGSAWTEHREPVAPPPPPIEPPATPPPSEQPTSVVSLPPSPAARGGAHRRPDPEDQPEPTSQFDPGPTASFSQPTTPVVLPPEPAPTPPEPPTVGPPPTEPPSFETPPTGPPSFEAPPTEPPSFETPPTGPPPAEPNDRGKLLLRFGVACAALLAVLVVAVIYALFLHKDNTIQIGGPSTSTAESTSKSSSPTSGTKASASETESPTAGGQATDSGLTFAVTGVETAPSVQYQDAPVEKTAQGEFVIVHMTVLNSGDAPTTFLGTLQKLKAGGQTYSIDDEATFYLDGGLSELNPGDTADVAVAFDVPPGTTPESIELHGDPISSGVEVPLS